MFRFRSAVILLAALALAPPAHAATMTPPPPEHRADPSLTTYIERVGPYTLGPYDTLNKSAYVKPPPVPGAIVAMDARLVDAKARPIPQHVAMLHHLVFTNGGADNRREDAACPGRSTRERFYGTSEELRPLTLPPGYGYPTTPEDRWRALVMVMHHRAGQQRFYLEYRVTVDPRPQIPVTPYWLSVVPCTPDPQWTVPGGGRGEHFNSRTFTMPKAGRIVAVGGHLHGGATRLVLSQPACGGRTLVTSRPSYAPADDKLYAVRPLLHEPDPKSISWWQSPTGWAIRAGEKLRVTAAYDATRPHMRVMGIDHVYLAPPAPAAPAAPRCAPPPPDAQILGPEFAGARAAPPRVRLTLARIGSDGRARPTTRAPGPTRRTTNVRIAGFAFHPPNLIVKRGAVVRWRFRDRGIRHDVTVASGPVGFGSPWHRRGSFRHRFTQPGRYLLQCSLHPAYMSQVVRVRR